MFTAKITAKKEVPQGLQVTVEFTDGVDTVTETVIPQDRKGFEHWVESRKESLTTAKELKTEDNIGVVIEPTEKADTRTAAEIARDEWLQKYYKWVQIKNNLIDTGVLTGNEKPVKDYLADVQAGFKPAYINFI